MRNRKHSQLDRSTESVNMTPMLDIVFIMLIFFIVTTSFVSEIGVPVHGFSSGPENEQIDEFATLAVRIEDGNIIRIGDRVVDVAAVAANLQSRLAENPRQNIVVLTGPDSDARTLVAVIDAVRSTGVDSVPVGPLD